MSDKPVYIDLTEVNAELHRREQMSDEDRLLLLERNVVLLLDTCELLLHQLDAGRAELAAHALLLADLTLQLAKK